MKTFKEACAELAADEGVYCLYLTGDQARAALRALQAAPEHDGDAGEARERLQRMLDRRQSARLDGGGEAGVRPVWHAS